MLPQNTTDVPSTLAEDAVICHLGELFCSKRNKLPDIFDLCFLKLEEKNA